MYKVRCVIVDCWTAHQPFSTSLNNNSSPPLSYNWCTSRVLNHFRRFPYQNMHRQINKKARKKNRTRLFNSFLFQVEMWGGHSAPLQRALPPIDLHITAFNGEILFYTLVDVSFSCQDPAHSTVYNNRKSATLRKQTFKNWRKKRKW